MNEFPRLMAGGPADRTAGLEPLLDVAAGASILDCGCHRGFIAAEFARAGAKLIDAFDRYEPAVIETREKLAKFPIQQRVEVLDLLEPTHSLMRLLDRYDIVLYLGLHHKILHDSPDKAADILTEMLDRAGKYFAVRTPAKHFPVVDETITAAGFKAWIRQPQLNVGELRIYQRL